MRSATCSPPRTWTSWRAARTAIPPAPPSSSMRRTSVLDVQMPGLSGLDILAEARAGEWRTRVMLLTAGVDPEPLVQAVRLNVDGLILKGASAETLVKAAKAVLQGQ